MYCKAYAKINLSLDVVGKREDGYHLLKMIMQNIDLYDVISVDKISSGIELTCNKPYVPVDDKNIAYKAASLFLKEFNINSGVKIDIQKNIPVSAGLAGGSTNAAAVLKLMAKVFSVNVTKEKLMEMGLKLGADVPYCIVGGTALCEGIGEIVTPLKPFRNHILVVVKPSFGVSTKDVYCSLDISKIRIHPNTDTICNAISKGDVRSVAYNLKNVLENVTLHKHKCIKEIKESMLNQGARGTLMSGSGPTVFGMFEDMLKAQKAYDEFKKHYKEVYITRTI